MTNRNKMFLVASFSIIAGFILGGMVGSSRRPTNFVEPTVMVALGVDDIAKQRLLTSMSRFVVEKNLTQDQMDLQVLALQRSIPCDSGCEKFWESNGSQDYHSKPIAAHFWSEDGRTIYTVVPAYKFVVSGSPIPSYEPRFAIYMRNVGPEGYNTLSRYDETGRKWILGHDGKWNESFGPDFERNHYRKDMPKRILLANR